ncbi:hypothetical protein pdam_00018714, partial [Pocillopora damicornis]
TVTPTLLVFTVSDVSIVVCKETLDCHVHKLHQSVNLHAPVIFKTNASFKVTSKTAKTELFQFAQKRGDDILIFEAFEKNKTLKIFKKSDCCAHMK